MFNANEDMFLKAFDSTPKLNLATQKKLELELARVMAIISNQSAEWDNRVQAIKHFRSLVNSGVADSDDFHITTLKQLEIPFQNNICDLRSQVVRETCITIAFLSCRLQQKFARMAEVLLPSLVKLIPNSAKIVSTSAFVALRFIIQSTHNSKLITIIKYQLSTSKSKEIHRALCEIAERIVTIWSPHIIERHLNDFVEVLRLGICDSDELARQSARRAFNVFAEHFREPADKLFNSLDQQRQRMLNNLNHGGGSTLSMNGYGSSITTNLHTLGHQSSSSSTSSSTTANHITTATVYSRVPSVNLVSRLKTNLTITGTNGTTSNQAASAITTSSPSRIRTPTARSTSAIDVNAQRRARARAVYLSSMYTRPRPLGTAAATTTSAANSNSITSNSNSNHLTTKAPNTASPAKSTFSNHLHQNNMTSIASNPKQNTPKIMLEQRAAIAKRYSPAPGFAAQQQFDNNSSKSQPTNHPSTPNVAQQQQQLQQLQQQQAASAERRDGTALTKAASYLLSVMSSNTLGESQIVTTIKYFNSLIEKHSTEIVNQHLPELMPPLVIGIDNTAICVRKASVFAMVAIHAKVGLKQMETYLTSLTMTQRKLLEVYIKKFKEENRGKVGGGDESTSSTTNTGSSSARKLSSSGLTISSNNNNINNNNNTSTSFAHQQQQPQATPDLI